MNLLAEQGSMIVTWDDEDIIRITHTAPDAYNANLGHKRADVTTLTARELEVLERVVDGDTNEEIGDRLKISADTAKFHVSNVMKKLGAKNRVAVAVLAVRKGLVQ